MTTPDPNKLCRRISGSSRRIRRIDLFRCPIRGSGVSSAWLLIFAIAGSVLAVSTGVSEDGAAKPLKVFILCGQSNMQGHAEVRTLEHLKLAPETLPMYEALVNRDGTPRIHENVWISYLSSEGFKHGALSTGYGANQNKLGPELAFGTFLQKKLGQKILIIKTAWGGKSLHTDFRPPGAGPYPWTNLQIENIKRQGKDLETIQKEKMQVTGHSYREMVGFVHDVLSNLPNICPGYDHRMGYEISGFVWFQGWNDMVDRDTYPNRDQPGGYQSYTDVLAHFIRDVRNEFTAPQLPFVIGVLGVGGPVDQYPPDQQRYIPVHQNFRDAMAAPASMPEFRGNVAAVLTENLWDQQLTALRSKENQINQLVNQQIKNQEIQREDQKSVREKLISEHLTPEEIHILRTGISNLEFHYLGSAKIITYIGQNFAEAMGKLME